MRSLTALTLTLIALLVVATVGIGAVAGAGEMAHTPHSTSAASVDTQQQLETASPAQVITIDIQDDGDVRWTLESRFLLTDESDRESFESFAAAVEAGERDAGYDPALFETFVTEASAATDREMAIEAAGYDEPTVESPNESADEPLADTEVGTISYSFTWTNFTTTDDNRIYFGDAFQTTDGTWFTGLSDEQQLRITIPDNYGFETSPPVGTENGALVWDGPHEFGDDELEIVLLRGADPPANGGEPDPPATGWLDSALIPFVGGAIVLLVGGVATYFLLQRRPSSPADETAAPARQTDGSSADARASTDTTTSTASTDTSPASRESLATDRDGHSSTDTAVAEDEREDENEDDEDDGIDPELLSDEERVLRLLRGNGGRMKQASIVKETDWSNAKVSQLLSKMDEDDEIEKLRIGRENLITLPEVDPTEID